MSFSNDFHTSELNNDLLPILAGLTAIDRADRWLQVALSIARNHREYADVIERQAGSKFSGYELEKVRRQFEVLHAEQGIALLFKQHVEANSTPLIASIVHITEQTAAAVQERSERHVLADPELWRIADARGEALEARLWLYAQQFGDGSGKVEKMALFDHLKHLGIINSKRTLDNILQVGQGIYWTTAFHKNAAGQEVLFMHLTGQRRLSERLTLQELQKAPYIVPADTPGQQPIVMGLVDTNRPGMSRVWVDLSGSISEARITAYAAWRMSKTVKDGYSEISRRVLQALWHRSRKTLIEWEHKAGIINERKFAEHHDITAPLVPAYAYLCKSKLQGEFASWRETNRITYKPINIHQHNGQRRKVRKAVNAIVKTFKPANVMSGGLPREERIGRIHFSDRLSGVRDKNTHRFPVTQSGFKRLNSHLKKHGDVSETRHYVDLGQRHGIHITEYSTGENRRSIHDVRDFKTEHDPLFIAHMQAYRRLWGDRYTW